jgi:hypothetical protein
VNFQQGRIEVPNMVVAGPSTEGLVQAMSQVTLKLGEIKGLKGDIENLNQEMKTKYERMSLFQ